MIKVNLRQKHLNYLSNEFLIDKEAAEELISYLVVSGAIAEGGELEPLMSVIELANLLEDKGLPTYYADGYRRYKRSEAEAFLKKE